MNNLFKNMLPYEVMLTVMGIVVFLVLIFALIWNVVKGRSVAGLLPVFLIPVVMVAYPTLQSIRIGEVLINIKNQTAIVQNNPSDTNAANLLKESLNQVKTNSRFLQNGHALLVVANAQAALGRYDSASLYLHKAAKISPQSEELLSAQKALNEKIEVRKILPIKLVN